MKQKYKIDSEHETIKPQYYKKDGKNVYVDFGKCFNTDSEKLNMFKISKSAYSKNLESTCRYSNIFFKEYDKDKEFLTGLLYIKYQIDNKDLNYMYSTFLYDISEYLLTDSVIEKIFAMVEDYYIIDLTPTDDIKNLNLYALQFTNDHGKALMALSIAYKLTIPVVCHYYSIYAEIMAVYNKARKLPQLTLKDYLYNTFISFFPLFQGEGELFNKVLSTVNSHLTATANSEKILWARARNKKITPTIYSDKLVEAVIVDLLPKAMFSKNLIFLIQVAIPYQIKTMLLAKDKYDYSEISTSIKNDELSGLEKMEANSARISDLDVIISSINIKDSLKKIQKKFNIYVDKDEIKWYKDNLNTFIFSDIVLQFFAKYFGGYYDLNSISKKDYIKLLIIFKKIMASLGFVYIHQIMSGNLSKAIKRRKISNKQLAKIETSARFVKMMEQYTQAISSENNPIIKTIAMLINTAIEYCDYDNPDMNGTLIEADIEIISDEYVRFLKLL